MKCGFLDTEHLSMLTINCLTIAKFRMLMDIMQNVYNAYSTPKSFFNERDFDGWDPKIHNSRDYLQIFHVSTLIDKCGTTKHYPLALFRNFI